MTISDTTRQVLTKLVSIALNDSYILWLMSESQEDFSGLGDKLGTILAELSQPAPTPNADGLLPCPFCGGNAESWAFSTEIDKWRVECEGCGATVSSGRAPEEAELVWNRRTTTPAAVNVPEGVDIPFDVKAAIGDVWGFAYAGASIEELEQAASFLMDWAHEVQMRKLTQQRQEG